MGRLLGAAGFEPDYGDDAPWWAGIIQQGIATTPAIIAASKKENIPGFPGSVPAGYSYNPYGTTSPYGSAYYAQSGVGGNLAVTPGGISSSLNISPNILIIGGLLLLVMTMGGKKR